MVSDIWQSVVKLRFQIESVDPFKNSEGLGVTFRNCQVTENITKKLLEDRSFVEECISSDFAFLRGTPNYVYYWAQRKRDVFAMTRQLGKPTLFMTLSISELRNEHLLQLIENLNEPVEKRCHKVDDMHSLYKASLVNNDPVVCALFFDKLVRVIMVVLQNTKISTFRIITLWITLSK
ncbi:hypothetical protein MRX96_047413 [Rhipicephalus microplus]